MKQTSVRYRATASDARRVVIKIGSRVLVQKTGRPDRQRMRALTQDIAALQRAGREVLIVTSGAIGAGMEALGMKTRPVALPEQQMAAAVGQTRLMSRYAELFERQGCKVGQVLLTHADFHHKIRLTNIRRTLDSLILHRVIPVINENDVVADEEIKADMAFGDNDNLAALVARLVRADLLVILTTVDGLREPGAAGRTRRVRYLESITRKTFALVTEGASLLSKGGMTSKLKAAKSVAEAGCATVIANGRTSGTIGRIVAGDDVGTLVLPAGV